MSASDGTSDARWEIVVAHRCTTCGHLDSHGHRMVEHLRTHDDKPAAPCGVTDPLGHPCALLAGHPPADARRGIEHVCEHVVALWPHLAAWQSKASERGRDERA